MAVVDLDAGVGNAHQSVCVRGLPMLHVGMKQRDAQMHGLGPPLNQQPRQQGQALEQPQRIGLVGDVDGAGNAEGGMVARQQHSAGRPSIR